METNDVEEVFTIESGNGMVDVRIVAVKKDDWMGGSSLEAVVRKELLDTSFLIFSEGLSSPRRIGLIKIGADNYYALQKDKSIVYKLTSNVYVFPAQDSIDFTLEELWMILVIKSDKDYVITQFDEILNYFANVVTEVPGEVPELDAFKSRDLIPDISLYPKLPEHPPEQPESSTTPQSQPLLQPSTQPQTFRTPSPSTPAKTIAKGLVTGAEYVAMGFNAGTHFAESLVRQGGEHLVNQEMNYHPKTVDPQVIRNLKIARQAAETCSTVAETTVDKIAEGARCLGRKLVPHIQNHGTRLVSSATGADCETSGRYVSDVISVTASGLQGLSTIYQSVTAGAIKLSQAVAGETVKYVQRRYGDDAAEATNEALYTAGNVAKTAKAVTDLGPKTIVKRAAREAAAESIRSFDRNASQAQA